MSEPLLTVCLITYNHAKYISQATESVLMQKTNFNYKLLIADDFSTDGTREIVLEYKSKYPNLIELILQEKNVGPGKNFLDLITTPKTKYIAYFEGDDYWTDPNKLQKQFDFLEANPEYGMVHTDADLKTEHRIIKSWHKKNNSIFTSDDYPEILFRLNPIRTVTTVARRELINKVIDEIDIPKYDLTLWLYIGINSKIHYLSESTSVYRIHKNSESNNLVFKSIIKLRDDILNIRLWFLNNYKLPTKCLVDTYYTDYRERLLLVYKTNSFGYINNIKNDIIQNKCDYKLKILEYGQKNKFLFDFLRTVLVKLKYI